MSQILTQVEAILKDKYQPALVNQISTCPSPFLEKIKRVPLTNNTIKCAAPIGINGGFGFGAEGVATPVSGAQRYAEFSIDAVDMYVDIQISNKTVQLASSNVSAMLNALDQEIKGSYHSAEWNLSRALFGNGSGILCSVIAADTNTANTTTLRVNDTSKLVEGLTVDIHTYATATATEATLAATNKAVRILSIDRTVGSIVLDSPSVAVTVALTANSVTPIGTFGFITVQNSYNRELCGLGAIYDDKATTLYGVNKADNPWIKPIVIDAQNDISDLVIYSGVKRASDYKGTKIDLVMMGDNAFAAYQDYMRTNNVVVVDKQRFVGGAVGYKVLCGSQETVILNERFVPENEAWAVDSTTFLLEQTPWDFMAKDGAVFLPMAGTSVYRALLTSYGNLVCTNPGGCVRFINCNSY
ncbi:MAG: phage major capsid protein [Clostridia bacterium]|nr:phage major capsid protein [Clostridia bacterium]